MFDVILISIPFLVVMLMLLYVIHKKTKVSSGVGLINFMFFYLFMLMDLIRLNYYLHQTIIVMFMVGSILLFVWGKKTKSL